MNVEMKHREVEQRLDRENAQKRRIARRTAVVSIAVRATLVVIKYTFAVLSGSMALMADAVNNLSDTAQSFTLWIGLKISGRKSSSFPYGLYKLENLISLGIAVLITFVGYELARHAILGDAPDELTNLPWTMAAIVIAMLISLGFSRYEAGIAARTGSPALEADSRDALVDALAAFAVLVSIVAAYFGVSIDMYVTLVIVAFILFTAAQLAFDAIRVLLDASLDRELLDAIEATIEADPDVLEVHHLRGRNSGPYRFVEAHVVLDVHDLEQAHGISYRLEEAVRDVAPNIDRVLIHFEPEHRETYTCAVPMLDSYHLSPKFGEAARYALVTVGCEDRAVREVREVANPWEDEPGGRGIRVAQMLIEEGADAVFTREPIEGKGPFYVLSAGRVEVHHTDAETLPEALAEQQIHLEVHADAAENV